MARKLNKSESITFRVDTRVKQELMKLATAQRRELSDYLRLVITDIIDKKITL